MTVSEWLLSGFVVVVVSAYWLFVWREVRRIENRSRRKKRDEQP